MDRRQALAGGCAWLGASAAREPDPPRRTLAYGPHPLQRLDLYPGATPGAPAFAWIPGGSWTTTSRRSVGVLPRFARRENILLASLGQRRAPEASAADQADDVARAIARLAANAGKLGFARKRLFLGGHSSGGHLAALVALDPSYLGAHGLTPAVLAGVILLDGAGYDARDRASLTTWREGSDALFDRIFGPDPVRVSPTLLAREARTPLPRFQIFYVANRPYAVNQSLGLARALAPSGAEVEVHAVRGHTHISVAMEFGAVGDPQGRRASRFIRKS